MPIYIATSLVIMALLLASITWIVCPTIFTTTGVLLLLVLAAAGTALTYSSNIAAAVSMIVPPTNTELLRIDIARLHANLEKKESEYDLMMKKYVRACQKVAVLIGRNHYLEDMVDERDVLHEWGMARMREDMAKNEMEAAQAYPDCYPDDL